jgi:hypothetical protein
MALKPIPIGWVIVNLSEANIGYGTVLNGSKTKVSPPWLAFQGWGKIHGSFKTKRMVKITSF